MTPPRKGPQQERGNIDNPQTRLPLRLPHSVTSIDGILATDILILSLAIIMAEPMDVDSPEPRGTKRTADEAGLPPEAPRRIKARHPFR